MAGWAAISSVLAGLPLLTCLDDKDLTGVYVDLSYMEEGMALAATSNLRFHTSSLQDLNIRYRIKFDIVQNHRVRCTNFHVTECRVLVQEYA